jgi:hypothetical protein
MLPLTHATYTSHRFHSPDLILYYFSIYALQPFKAYCAIWVRRSNFRHQASPSVSPRDSTQRRKVELWARNVRYFYLNADLHVTFRDLLHAVKLRHGTDGFTSPPKEGVLRIFSVRTRELGYQRPARYLQTTEAAFSWLNHHHNTRRRTTVKRFYRIISNQHAISSSMR